MAGVATIIGGTAGFLSAAVSVAVMDASWISALELWTGVGIVVATVLLIKPAKVRVDAITLGEMEHA